MNKIRIKDLIEFRNKNERTRITFVQNLKKEKDKAEKKSGGDYWISCLSAIRNSFKLNNKFLMDEKIEILKEKINVADKKITKNQFQKNIDVLENFKEYELISLKPNADLIFLKQSKLKSLLDVNSFPIEVKPCYIYKFSINNSDEVGGVWFVAKLDGFKKSELAMFTDIMYRYLLKNYSNMFYVNPDYCIAVDIFRGQEVRYSEIKKGEIPILIENTIEKIKQFN